MKKILIVFAFILILVAAAVYSFIPRHILISKVSYINASRHAINRLLADSNKWNDWGSTLQADEKSVRFTNAGFNYKNADYIINSRAVDLISITVRYKKNVAAGIINIISLSKDSSAIQWKSALQTNNNPINKINSYFNAKKIKNDMAEILESLKRFLETPENIYGISIKQEKVRDTLLISIKSVSNNYPSTTEVYSLIKSLKDYISLSGAKETNYPMLHIRNDSGFFNTMVAIPINRLIPQTNKFIIKRMVPGKILVTDVKGGIYSTSKALMQLDNYIRDNFLVSPAIPFESLVTNREKETDTAKWVTKIYYPIY